MALTPGAPAKQRKSTLADFAPASDESRIDKSFYMALAQLWKRLHGGKKKTLPEMVLPIGKTGETQTRHVSAESRVSWDFCG